ncbi:MAG: helix-turn-helix domain-containing protein [Sciscionella sp.]
MAGRTSPTFRRRRLARRLKQLRESAGLTLEQAAPRLDKTRSTLGRIEKGQTKADVHLVRSMMDLYDERDDALLDLAREAAQRGWWRAYGIEDLGYVDVETEASAVLEFSGLNIPGLLQTEAYARAQLRAGRRRTKEQFENQVQVRAIRKQRLTDDEHPLELTVIIDEAALTREVGGREVMGEQLRHLVQVSELARLSVQVLPFRSGTHDAMGGAFIVLEFPEPEDPDLLYVEYATGALHIEKAEEVRAATLVFDRLRSQALPPEDSVALIERLAGEMSGTR